MRHSDTRKVIAILYVLTLLFLAVIYMQDALMADPGAMVTMQNAAQVVNDANGITNAPPLINIQINGNSGIALFCVITMVFVMVWRVFRSRPYEA